MQKSIIIVLCACLCVGCASARVPDNGSGADAVREHIEELGEKQTDVVITGTELKSEVAASRETVENLDRTVTSGASDLERFKAILQRIRKRGCATQGNAVDGKAPAPENEGATQ